jgi:AbiV family abortive infection protein
MLKHTLLPQFKGRITPAQAAEGMRIAHQNAVELLMDSQSLLKQQRWPRAAALAILAIEEAGKPAILRALLVAKAESEVRQTWREYRTHVNKNVMWIFSELVAKGGRRLDDFRAIFDGSADHAAILEAVKQIALYTDSYDDCYWSAPADAIDKELANAIVAIAAVLVGSHPAAMTSEAELEIWAKHMGPVWKQGREQMETALLECYKEAEEKGLLTGTQTLEEMMRFLGLT